MLRSTWLLSAVFACAATLVSVQFADACRTRRTVCYPCWDHTSCCICYKNVGDPVEIKGPYWSAAEKVKVGHGVIVRVNVPSGIHPAPTDQFSVIFSGPGEVKYEGYNKVFLEPGKPGGTVQYSFFLCPTKAGKCDVKVGFIFSDNTIHNVPFSLDIVP
jgi:hypothetical protein